MSTKLLINFVFFVLFAVFSSNALEPELTSDKITFNGYEINTLYSKQDKKIEKLVISKNKKIIFTAEGIISIKQGRNLNEVQTISKIKDQLLIIEDYSRGAHCCYTTTIIKLNDPFKIIATLHGENSPVVLNPISKKAHFVASLQDWTYAYKWVCFAKSPAPKVILHYQDNQYVPDLNSMKKNKLSLSLINKSITAINDKLYPAFNYGDEDNKNREEYLAKLLHLALDLTYKGQVSEAWKAIHKTWPGDLSSKNQFIEDFKKTLKESPYYESINALNNGNI
jgi:hypothetical protein